MTMALINATLTYRLAITNHGNTPLGPLRISSDMISAHGSLQAAEQLVPDPDTAGLSHEFEAIPPGESIELNGELRLPRTEILPVRSGNGALFLPLARFTIQTKGEAGLTTAGSRVFIVGEDPDQPGAPLLPFRLNDGTRIYSRVSQREVAASA